MEPLGNCEYIIQRQILTVHGLILQQQRLYSPLFVDVDKGRLCTCRFLEAVHLLQQVVVMVYMCLLVAEHDAIQIREVPVQVHTIVICSSDQVVRTAL